MIHKIASALAENDYHSLAECFSENCIYRDFCPCLNGEENYYLYGSASLEMFFHERFLSKRIRFAEPLIESERSATFFSEYNDGPYLYSRLEIEALDADGYIQKAVMHPA